MEPEIVVEFKNFDEMRNFGATSPPKIVNEYKEAKETQKRTGLNISRHWGGGGCNTHHCPKSFLKHLAMISKVS